MRDTEGAKYVAAHRNGDEEVPTAFTGTNELIDATPEAIRTYITTAR